ncbi:hypothetical protein R3W88_004529 [Solanum pinnatisectum]|uniref:Uncharacterized protein n=1 Tax=Solanum pinnatisectum TaxID=50273 RepID=A0AAV9KA03_9SOLN|nr:hypothetical protein R3W88_004529 [Solanum pinnatisectum]
MGRPFHLTIKIGEMVESGLKIGRIVSQATIKATTQAIQGGSGISSLASGSRGAQRNSNCPYPPVQGQSSYPQHYYLYVPQYPVSPYPYTVFNAQSYGHKRKFTSLGKSYSNLFQKLMKIGVIESIPPYRLNPTAPGHNTDNCWTLKGAIEKLINHGVVVVTNDQNTPNETNNPLPEDMLLKNSNPVASLSVEGVNLDTKVLCVPRLYVSKGFSLAQQDQSCLAKLKEPIFVKPVQQLSVTDTKVVPWNYNKIIVVYRGKEIKVPDYSVVEQ